MYPVSSQIRKQAKRPSSRARSSARNTDNVPKYNPEDDFSQQQSSVDQGEGDVDQTDNIRTYQAAVGVKDKKKKKLNQQEKELFDLHTKGGHNAGSQMIKRKAQNFGDHTIDDISLLKLKFAVSIITNDNHSYKRAVNEVSVRQIYELLWLTEESPHSIRSNGFNTNSRSLVTTALQVTVRDGDRLAVTDILKFCEDRRIMLFITSDTMVYLTQKRDFEMIKLLIQNNMYLQEEINTDKEQTRKARRSTQKKNGKQSEILQADQIFRMINKSKNQVITKERKLKVADFASTILEQCPFKERKIENKNLTEDLFEVFESLQDMVDYPFTIQSLRKYGMDLLIYKMVERERITKEHHLRWLIESFKYSLVHEQMDLAVNLWDKYSNTFDKDSQEIIESILISFAKSSYFMELKFFILDQFFDNLEYQQIDRLLSILENCIIHTTDGESVLLNNINPIITSVQIMNYLEKIVQAYTVTEQRVVIIHKHVMDKLKSILVNLYNPIEIKTQVMVKDIFKTNAITYMETMDAYQLMNTKIMDRIMKELWNTDFDMSGSFWDQSTCLQLIKNPEEEQERRFWVHRKDYDRTRTHSYVIRIWTESIWLRYQIEVFIYFIISLFFQYTIERYTHNQIILSDMLDIIRKAISEGAPEAELDIQRANILDQVNVTAEYLNLSGLVQLNAIAATLKTLVTLLYVRWTKRTYSWQAGDQIDAFACFFVLSWIYFQIDLSTRREPIAKNWEGILDVSQGGTSRLMANIFDDHEGINFRIEFIIGLVAALNWFRLLIMLFLTKTFGPMITIFQSMFQTLIQFFLLWFIFLMTFASIGYLVFNELEAMSSLYKAWVVHFEAALGNWSLTIYNGYSLGEAIPVWFHVASVIINMVLMLNLVIAILSETYARLASQKLGLYYDGLIASLPAYQNDPRWSIMILVPPPFNVLTLPFILVFACYNYGDKVKMKQINHIAIFVFYTPLALTMLVFFTVGNGLVFPFTYLYIIYYKAVNLCPCKRRTSYQKNKQNNKNKPQTNIAILQNFGNFTLFLIGGIPMLLLSQVRDSWYFFKHLYSWDINRLDDEQIKIVDFKSFVSLEIIMQEQLKDYLERRSDMLAYEQDKAKVGLNKKKKQDEEEDEEEYLLRKGLVNTKDIILKVRIGLNVIPHMKALIFGTDKSNRVTNRVDINANLLSYETKQDLEYEEEQLEGINPLDKIHTFNLIKKIIQRASKRRGKTGQQVLLIHKFVGLVSELRQRMSVQRSRGLVKFNEDIEKVMKKKNKCLRDFSLINPVKILEAIELGAGDN